MTSFEGLGEKGGVVSDLDRGEHLHIMARSNMD